MNICDNCKKTFSNELIITDHYKGEEIKKYCDDCFYNGALAAFNDDLKCDCGKRLVLVSNDKDEIIDLVQSDGIVDYECETINEARLKGEDIEKLEEEHSSIGFYVVQPKDQEWNNW